jgi:hypothetical protein
VILRHQESPVAAGGVFVLYLHSCGLKVAFASPALLFMSGTSVDSARASVVADTIHSHVIDDGLVVDVNVVNRHIVNRAVVIEVRTLPISPHIAGSKVAIPVVQPTIKTDVRPPIPHMPHIHTFTPTPISGCPEQTNRGRQHPGARYPVKAFRTIGPVTGRPDITVTWTSWLCVNR